MKKSYNVAVTGAGGQIGYALVFRIASGAFLGPEVKVNLQLLERAEVLATLEGLRMELTDCAFPTLGRVSYSAEPNEAFGDADFAFLVGASPRLAGMERKDLLESNAAIFAVQGKALSDNAAPQIKTLVVGNPANTNALIALHNAPKLNAINFSAMSRLDHNRTMAQLALRTKKPLESVSQVIVWGNHSSTQYPDIHHSKINGESALALVGEEWFKQELIGLVQQRGTSVIKARGSSSAASAANAALTALRDWHYGNPDWVSMSVHGSGAYDLDADLFYSYPIAATEGKISIIEGLEINDFSRSMLRASEQELQEEREAVKHLFRV